MKLVWHLVILGSLVSVCASTSVGQTPDSVRRGAGLNLSANVTPASIIELSSKSNYIEELETASNTMCALRVVLADSETADLVKQTAAGTLVMTRVEFLVRFSGFKDETATIVITVTAFDDESGRLSLREGTSEASLRNLQLGQVIKVEGVRSGERIVRYVGFLMDETVSGAPQKNDRGAALTYELIH
jgi:hypothetical protein